MGDIMKLEKTKPNFRILISDIENKKSRTITLYPDNKNIHLQELYKKIKNFIGGL